MTIWRNRSGTWEVGRNVKVYKDGAFVQAIAMRRYTGGAFRRVWPDTFQTTTTISFMSIPSTCGEEFTFSGTVKGVAQVDSGNVQMQYRYMDFTWTNLGSPSPVTSGNWSVVTAVPRPGDVQYRAVFTGGSNALDSTSSIARHTTLMGVPQNLRGVSVSDSSITVQWDAVPCAGDYVVFLNDLATQAFTGTSGTLPNLQPGTKYKINVVSRFQAVAGSPSSGWSNTVYGTTGRTEQRDQGSTTLNIIPWATGSWRPDVGWGYIGSSIGQGYYTNSGRNYTGMVDFYGANGQAVQQLGGGALGNARFANGTCSSGSMYLFKQSGVGSSGSVTIVFHHSNGWVNGSDLSGTAFSTQASSSSNAGKEYGLPAANLEEIIRGVRRSILLYRATSADYCRFNGGGTNGRLAVVWSWNYVSASAVAGGFSAT